MSCQHFISSAFLFSSHTEKEGYIKYVKVVLEETASQIYPPTVTWIIADVWANNLTEKKMPQYAIQTLDK